MFFFSNSGKKDKLIISACDVDADGNVKVDKNKSYEFMLNPSEYDHSYAIGYNRKEAIGQSGSEVKFGGVKPEKLKFAAVVDCSGAVADSDSDKTDVKTRIKELKAIVYQYDGKKHEPSHVRVLWGSQIFFGRLESMSVDNTMFKPSGEPLRARVKLEFIGFMSKQEEALRANRSSPDMSHLIEVQAGDTLPLLCHRVYRDSSYYLEVARVNGLTNFRELKAGSRLRFPPLDKN